MTSLHLNKSERGTLQKLVVNMEKEYGTDYSFVAEIVNFSCPCSAHAMSCIWH